MLMNKHRCADLLFPSFLCPNATMVWRCKTSLLENHSPKKAPKLGGHKNFLIQQNRRDWLCRRTPKPFGKAKVIANPLLLSN